MLIEKVLGKMLQTIQLHAQEINSVDDVEKMAYKVNEILLKARETIRLLTVKIKQTLPPNTMKLLKHEMKIKIQI